MHRYSIRSLNSLFSHIRRLDLLKFEASSEVIALSLSNLIGLFFREIMAHSAKYSAVWGSAEISSRSSSSESPFSEVKIIPKTDKPVCEVQASNSRVIAKSSLELMQLQTATRLSLAVRGASLWASAYGVNSPDPTIRSALWRIGSSLPSTVEHSGKWRSVLIGLVGPVNHESSGKIFELSQPSCYWRWWLLSTLLRVFLHLRHKLWRGQPGDRFCKLERVSREWGTQHQTRSFESKLPMLDTFLEQFENSLQIF